jgi:hypothetical protein
MGTDETGTAGYEDAQFLQRSLAFREIMKRSIDGCDLAVARQTMGLRRGGIDDPQVSLVDDRQALSVGDQAM